MQGTPATVPPTRAFLDAKVKGLVARARRLSRLTPGRAGLRRQDLPFAPSSAHFKAANRRLQRIDKQIEARLRFVLDNWRRTSPQQALIQMAMVEREIDRSRRTFGMFFEIFSQRGTEFAPALAAHDAIAADCYTAVRRGAPLIFTKPLLKPLTYMEHGYSPATSRRGVALSRLLGALNPFPIIRIPWDRDNPWQSVFLHEVGHNIQADLGVWQENKQALTRRMARSAKHSLVSSIYGRWHKEIFADLIALLLGGTASAWGMMDFLAHPATRTLTYKPGGAHPTGYFRGFILAEMLRRMGFPEEAAKARRVWRRLFQTGSGHRLPGPLLASADRVIPHVVDEVAFQTRRNLGQRALADVVRFSRDDEAAIRRGAVALANGRIPQNLPPRFLVSASRFALAAGAPARRLSDQVIAHLSRQAAEQRSTALIRAKAAA